MLALLGTATAQVKKGFNYGNTHSDGSAMTQSDFQAEFSRAQNLPGVSGFTSARLYTMIQGGTTNTPISAIPAAIDTKTRLLLGLWASAGSADFDNEVTALTSAITQYGTAFTDLIDGISVGSEGSYDPTCLIYQLLTIIRSVPRQSDWYREQERCWCRASTARQLHQPSPQCHQGHCCQRRLCWPCRHLDCLGQRQQRRCH